MNLKSFLYFTLWLYTCTECERGSRPAVENQCN